MGGDEMDLLSLGFAVVFGLIFLVSLGSAVISEKLPLSEPVIALGVGAVIGAFFQGPLPLGDTDVSRYVIHEVAEVTLSIALMTTALQVPKGYLRRHWKSVLVLLGLGMPLMWAASSLLVAVVLGLPLWIALFIGAAITPTDPVLASTIVTGRLAERHIASRLRHLIIVESGANDGLAYAFVLLPVNMLAHPPHQALLGWLVYSMLWEVGGALIFGVVIGLVAGWLTYRSFAADATQHSSFLGLTLALSLLTLGLLKLIGTDAILGVFVAGLVFSQTLGYRGRTLERAEHVQEAVERFFDLPVFIVLGAVLPWYDWFHMGWSALLLCLLVLALRRIPVLFLLAPWLKRVVRGARETLFIGWFGPIGISALFYATLTLPSVPSTLTRQAERIWPAITLVITASIVAHGISATPLTRLFGRNASDPARRRHDDAAPDHMPWAEPSGA